VADLTLEVVEGPDAGKSVTVGGPVVIGREGSELLVQDSLVSRRHVRISPALGGVTVEDLGSLNGTFVNGNELHGPVLATPGDQITVGVTVVEVRSPQQVREQPSAVRAVPQGLAVPPRRPDYLPPDLQAAGEPVATGGGPPVASAPGGYVPVGRPPEVPVPELDPLLDVRTKRLALIAPLAIFVVVVFALILFLATR
jgi:pSer/pThr/pTyr-binding forkhead associated (FHA) protein